MFNLTRACFKNLFEATNPETVEAEAHILKSYDRMAKAVPLQTVRGFAWLVMAVVCCNLPANAQQAGPADSETQQLKALVYQLQSRVEQLEKRLEEKTSQQNESPAPTKQNDATSADPVQAAVISKSDRSILNF